MNQAKQVDIPYTNMKMWVDEDKTKSPKLRFRPGMVFVYEGEIILVMAAFRLSQNDREWMYYCAVLSRRIDVSPEVKQRALQRAAEMDVDRSEWSQRIANGWLFRSSSDAMTYFDWIPRHGDGRILSNKNLLQKGERLIPEPTTVN